MLLLYFFLNEIVTSCLESEESGVINQKNVFDTNIFRNIKIKENLLSNKKRKVKDQDSNEEINRTKQLCNRSKDNLNQNFIQGLSLSKNNDIILENENHINSENKDSKKEAERMNIVNLHNQKGISIYKLNLNVEATVKILDDLLLRQNEHVKLYVKDQLKILKECWIREFKIYEILIQYETDSIEYSQKQIYLLIKLQCNKIKRKNLLSQYTNGVQNKRLVFQEYKKNIFKTKIIITQYENTILYKNQEMFDILGNYKFQKTKIKEKSNLYESEKNQKKTFRVDIVDFLWKKEIERQEVLKNYEKNVINKFKKQLCILEKDSVNTIFNYNELLIEEKRKTKQSLKQLKFLKEYRESIFLEYNPIEGNKINNYDLINNSFAKNFNINKVYERGLFDNSCNKSDD